MHAVGDIAENYENGAVIRAILYLVLRAVNEQLIAGSLLMAVAGNLQVRRSSDEDAGLAT